MHCRNCGNEVHPNAEICTKCGVRPANASNYCQNCGVAVQPNQEICIKCGVGLRRVATSPDSQFGDRKRGLVYPSDPPKSPTTALIFTCLITGVGQMYLGQSLKGVIILLAAIILAVPTAGGGPLILWIISMIDAYRIGKKLEAGQPVGEWEFF